MNKFLPILFLLSFAHPVQAVPPSPQTGAEIIRHALSDVAESSLPSVVTILSTKRLGNRFRGRKPLHEFFGNSGRGRQGYTQKGLGSGVIVSKKGLILTNHHVIADSDVLRVRLHNGDEFPATIVGSDPSTDIALIQIEAQDLRPAPLGNSDSLRIAELILCIGSPLSESLGHTVTRGIVSATGRSSVGISDYEDFIQTDAAINPGNSGGPMLNLDGEVVGINTAIASQTGGFQGVGFAVPSNLAKRVMNQLVTTGRVTRGWLGVVIQDIDDSLVKALGLLGKRGVIVTECLADSPAEKGGLEAGDVLISMHGKPLKSVQGLRTQVSQLPPGTQVRARAIRNGKERDFSIVLGELPGTRGTRTKTTSPQKSEAPAGLERLGINLGALTREKKKALGLPKNASGVLITRVENGKLGGQAGLAEGDLLVELNRKKIRTPKDAERILESLPSGASLLLKVKRGAGSLFLALRVP